MITQAEAQALWEQAKANGAKLEGCAGPHDFRDITPEKRIGKRYRCSKCTGEASSTDVHWYRLGLNHAQNSAP